MNYLTEVAQRIEAKAVAAGQGKQDPDVMNLYALLALTTGEATTLENVHDAWAVWRTRTKPENKYLVPFAELAEDVVAYDKPFLTAIWEVAGELAEAARS